MAYTDIAGLLLDGFPTENFSPGTTGRTYKYRGDHDTLETHKALIHEIWADGLPVNGVEFYRVGRSDIGEMIVTTQSSSSSPETVTSTLVETVYQIRWSPVDVPLEQHPAFVAGGASDLYATASGSPTRKHIADVFGWENEQDQVLKYAYQYKRLNSDGTVGATISLSGAALAFAKLRVLGFSTYPTYLPTWNKTGIYDGTTTPGVGTIGQYTATPDGSGYPTGYQWVKVTDDAQRIGRGTRWDRTEAWQGYVKVWLDIDTLNPAANTLPS